MNMTISCVVIKTKANQSSNKGWLRGIHQHVTNLQDYLNEYCYSFNRSFMKEEIFENLMVRMVKAEPCLIKNIRN
jgi:hypothetical protein